MARELLSCITAAAAARGGGGYHPRGRGQRAQRTHALLSWARGRGHGSFGRWARELRGGAKAVVMEVSGPRARWPWAWEPTRVSSGDGLACTASDAGARGALTLPIVEDITYLFFLHVSLVIQYPTLFMRMLLIL